MANEFTSIATTSGIGDNTVKSMYDFAIAAKLRERPQYRSWVDRRPERPNGPGQTITFQFHQWFDSTAVTAAKTPLNEEQDIDSTKLPVTTTGTVTANEYGFAVTRTKKLTIFSFDDIDRYAAEAVANHLADWQDSMVQDVMDTFTTNQIYAGNATAENNIDATDEIAAANIRKAVTTLRGSNVPTVDGVFYRGGIHPYVLHDLREETGSGSWRVPTEYGTDQSAIWRGEFGEFEGVRFVVNNNTRTSNTGASSETVARTYIAGPEAMTELVYQEPGSVISPVVDKLNRFRTIGWYGVLGWAKYRDESMIRILSSSSLWA